MKMIQSRFCGRGGIETIKLFLFSCCENEFDLICFVDYYLALAIGESIRWTELKGDILCDMS